MDSPVGGRDVVDRKVAVGACRDEPLPVPGEPPALNGGSAIGPRRSRRFSNVVRRGVRQIVPQHELSAVRAEDECVVARGKPRQASIVAFHKRVRREFFARRGIDFLLRGGVDDERAVSRNFGHSSAVTFFDGTGDDGSRRQGNHVHRLRGEVNELVSRHRVVHGSAFRSGFGQRGGVLGGVDNRLAKGAGGAVVPLGAAAFERNGEFRAVQGAVEVDERPVGKIDVEDLRPRFHVVAANAGGAWSPFGDITTLMAWAAGKAPFIDFFALFPASIIGWLVTAFLLVRIVPAGSPHFDPAAEPKVSIKKGGKVVIGLGVTTIFSAVMMHQLFHLPAMWGMMFGFSLLSIYTYIYKKTNKNEEPMHVFHYMSKIENNTLFFFFGILAAVGALHFVGFLNYAVSLYDKFGATAVNIGVGFLSAIVDNVPVMSAVLKANPMMGADAGENLSQWLLVTLTAGIGGSMISFGSAAGVGVMGKLKGIYTFGAHMKYAWTVVAGYIVSVVIWYIQFEIFHLYF